MRQTLRRVGESPVMHVPMAFIEQNGLTESALVNLNLNGAKMVVEARTQPRYTLSAMLAEMQDELPLVKGRETFSAVCKERSKKILWWSKKPVRLTNEDIAKYQHMTMTRQSLSRSIISIETV